MGELKTNLFTNKSQSKYLLDMGLKACTADKGKGVWSFDMLLDMIPKHITVNGCSYYFSIEKDYLDVTHVFSYTHSPESLYTFSYYMGGDEDIRPCFMIQCTGDNVMSSMMVIFNWLILNKHINKDYLND
jgi:hypothetical protein